MRKPSRPSPNSSARRIVGAAECWLAARPQDGEGDVRFDVVIVTPGKLPQHIPSAFDADV